MQLLPNFYTLTLIVNYLHTLFSKVRRSAIAQGTSWIMLAQGIGVVLQAVYFIVIARTIGVEGYGAFVGTTSLSVIFSSFASLGSGELLIQHVSRERQQFCTYWGRAICTTLISGSLLSIIVLALSLVVLPKTVSFQLVGLVVLSDLLCFRLIALSWQSYQAVGWMKHTAQMTLTPLVLRAVAAMLFALWSGSTADEWVVYYFVSTFIAAGIGVVRVSVDLGYPILGLPKTLSAVRDGIYFAVGISGQTIYNDIDKTMLAKFASLEATGFYASAYRILDVAFVPVRSLLFATYSKFFRQGKDGIIGSVQLAKRVLPIAIAYGFLAGIGLIAIAPALPYVFGKEYIGSVQVLQWLAPLPLLKTVQYFAADTLTGAGFQGIRSLLQGSIAAFNFGINLWLIPRYSWQGAVWSSLASDGLLLIGLCSAVAWYRHQQLASLKS